MAYLDYICVHIERSLHNEAEEMIFKLHEIRQIIHRQTSDPS